MTEEMTIRPAKESDIPRIVELGRQFLINGPYNQQVEDNPEKAAEFAFSVLHKLKGYILVSEGENGVNGVFSFIITPHYFSGELVATELIWYVEPSARKGGTGTRLLGIAERVARALGAKRMQLTAPTEEVGNLYKYCGGYKKIEVSYQRTL